MRRPRLTWQTFVPAFYWGGNYALRWVLWTLVRWKVYGRENVPARGPLIVIANHLNFADPPILASGVRRRRVVFMAKIELFGYPLGVITRLYGAFPVRRFDADLGAMLGAERLLKGGAAIGMFPEGTRSREHRFAELHPGTALIALRAGAQVLPCAITGTESITGVMNVLRRPHITVRIGRPIDVPQVRRPTDEQVGALTARLRHEIAALLPPRYGGSYTGMDGGDPARK